MFSQKVYINYMILIISHKLGYVITYALKNKKRTVLKMKSARKGDSGEHRPDVDCPEVTGPENERPSKR